MPHSQGGVQAPKNVPGTKPHPTHAAALVVFMSSTVQCGRLLEVLQRLTCTTVCTHTTPDNHWLVGWLVITLLLGGDEQGNYVCITPCAHAALLVSISGPVDVEQYSGTASRRTWKTLRCPSHFPWHPSALTPFVALTGWGREAWARRQHLERSMRCPDQCIVTVG